VPTTHGPAGTAAVPAARVGDAGPATAASPAARPPGAPPQRGADDHGGPATAASPMARPDLDDDEDLDEDEAGFDEQVDDLHHDDEQDDPRAAPAGLGRAPRRTLLEDRDEPDRDEYEDDGYDEDIDDDPGRPASSARDWIVMIVQLVVGALLGAVLWTVFSYLWKEQPVVALVLAAGATTGLVFGVRALRRSDDLQTTVLAVVVGLVVTVSPAVIVLLSR
jgi:hypothetical protein